MKITLSCFNSETDNQPKHSTLADWKAVVRFLLYAFVRDSKAGTKCFTPAIYQIEEGVKRPKKRAKENVQCVTLLVADFDGSTTPEQVCEILTRLGLAAVLCSSWSHFAEAGVWKFRVVIPLLKPIPAEEWHEGTGARLLVGLFGLWADASCLDASHLFYRHSFPRERAEHAFAFALEGIPLDPTSVEEPPPERIAEWFELYRRKRPRTDKPDFDQSYWKDKVAGVGTRPGDIYNREHAEEALNLLVAEGWRIERSDGKVWYLTRPGRNSGVSATFGYCRNADGVPCLYVWTSNAPLFESHRPYDPFSILALFRHNRDFSAAAKELVGRGIGKPAKKPPARSTGKGDTKTLAQQHSDAGNKVTPDNKVTQRFAEQTHTEDASAPGSPSATSGTPLPPLSAPYYVRGGQTFRVTFSQNGPSETFLADCNPDVFLDRNRFS
jgi:hypothetical protein